MGDGVEALEWLRGHFEEGADPNLLLREGDTHPITALLLSENKLKDRQERLDQVREAINIFIRAGANPLLDPSDVFLLKLSNRTPLVASLVKTMAEMEMEGRGLRDRKGQGFAHILLLLHWDRLVEAGPAWDIWLNLQRKEDLKTPLHVLWKGDPQITAKGKSTPSAMDMQIHAIFIWAKTSLALRAGARLDLKDASGESVAECIQRRAREKNLPMPVDKGQETLWEEIQAEVDAQTLSLSSKSPVHSAARPSRL